MGGGCYSLPCSHFISCNCSSKGRDTDFSLILLLASAFWCSVILNYPWLGALLSVWSAMSFSFNDCSLTAASEQFHKSSNCCNLGGGGVGALIIDGQQAPPYLPSLIKHCTKFFSHPKLISGFSHLAHLFFFRGFKIC